MGSGDTAEALGRDWGGVSTEWDEPDNARFPGAGFEGDLEAIRGPAPNELSWDCCIGLICCIGVGGGPEGDDGDHHDGV